MNHMPKFARGAAERVRDIDHLAALLWAWRQPEVVYRDARHSDREHRRRGGVSLIVTDDDMIIGCADVDHTQPTRPVWAQQQHKPGIPRKRGGAGTRWPTTTRELIERVKQAGGTVDCGGNKHWRVTLPAGGTVVLGQTPSDYRSVKNSALQLHRAGLNVARF